MNWSEILQFLESRKNKLEAVVFSGGEPLLQENIVGAFNNVRELGFAVKLDTNGTLPGKLKDILENNPPDYLAMDLKAPPELLIKATGISLGFEPIRKSINLIMSSGVEYEFRTTLIPGIHSGQTIHKMASLINGAKRYVLQNLSGFPTLEKSYLSVTPFKKEVIEEYKDEASNFVDECLIRN